MRVFRSLVVLVSVLALASCAAPRLRTGVPPRTPAPTQRGTIGPNDILFRAIALVGTPYRYGGNTPQGGFDCSGLVDYVFRDVAGVVLPRTAREISEIDAPAVDRDDLDSGDLVFFHGHTRQVTHVGIYVGKGSFVHAPNAGGTVRLDRLDDRYWREHYAGARRVPL